MRSLPVGDSDAQRDPVPVVVGRPLSVSRPRSLVNAPIRLARAGSSAAVNTSGDGSLEAGVEHVCNDVVVLPTDGSGTEGTVSPAFVNGVIPIPESLVSGETGVPAASPATEESLSPLRDARLPLRKSIPSSLSGRSTLPLLETGWGSVEGSMWEMRVSGVL